MIIDCISDLHGEYPILEGGDLLIVAGDLLGVETEAAFEYFDSWLFNQKYKHKIVIAGNHDTFLEKMPSPEKYFDKTSHTTYLCDSGTDLHIWDDLTGDTTKDFTRHDLKIWGSPWTKTFYGMNPNCKAFTCDNEAQLAEKWAEIPDDIEILITHSPPYGILDRVSRYSFELSDEQNEAEHVGSKTLRSHVLSRTRFPKLKLHVFGHIHECGGQSLKMPVGIFVNASILDGDYQHVNKPVRIEL